LKPLLETVDALEIKKLFSARLTREVRIAFFASKKKSCQYCKETEQLLREISELSQDKKIILEVLDLEDSHDMAEELEVSLVPATVILSNNGSRLFYFGMPSGYQLKSLIEDILDASQGTTNLPQRVKERINSISQPVNLKIFVTPACPYSPSVVHTAHRFAIENKLIRAEMIESLEFHDLTEKYGVVGVPKIIINDSLAFEGVSSEEEFAKRIGEASRSLPMRQL
jgi:glutaredoxin-like protein